MATGAPNIPANAAPFNTKAVKDVNYITTIALPVANATAPTRTHSSDRSLRVTRALSATARKPIRS